MTDQLMNGLAFRGADTTYHKQRVDSLGLYGVEERVELKLWQTNGLITPVDAQMADGNETIDMAIRK